MALGVYLGAGTGATKGLWHLDGSSADSSGNANNGTDTSVSYSKVDGFYDQGATMTTSSKISCGTSSTLQQSIFTYVARINTTDTSVNKSIIIAGMGGNSPQWRIETSLKQQLNKQGVAGIATSTTAVSSGVSTTVAVSYNNSSGVCTFYLNGAADGGATSAQTFTFGTFQIGNVTSESYVGKVDEVIVENYVWTALQHRRHYTYAKGRFGIL